MIPDNEDREDSKIYFFFTEKALEAETDAQAIYSRVGRVCAVSTPLADPQIPWLKMRLFILSL